MFFSADGGKQREVGQETLFIIKIRLQHLLSIRCVSGGEEEVDVVHVEHLPLRVGSQLFIKQTHGSLYIAEFALEASGSERRK